MGEGVQHLLVEAVGVEAAARIEGVEGVAEAARAGVTEIEATLLLAAQELVGGRPGAEGLPRRHDARAAVAVVGPVGQADRPGAGLGDQRGRALPQHVAAEPAHPVDVEHGCPGRRLYSAWEPAEWAARCSLPGAPIHTVLAFMNSYMPRSVSSRP